MKKLLTIISTAFILLSCEPNLNYEIHGYSQKIIVEGYISNDQYAQVYLSLNVPVWQTVDSATILDNVIRTAKVSISDGETTEVLTSSWDKQHFPPYVYKGTEIKGKEGKTYYLTVEYSGYTLFATTTLPASSTIESFASIPTDNDSLKQLVINLNVNSNEKKSFRVYTKKTKDGFYTETPVIFNEDLKLSGPQTFVLNPNPKSTDPSYNEGHYFLTGDTVFVKLCTLDSISTQFFKELSVFSSTSGLGENIFVGEKEKLNSNISEPGFGIWYGTGIKTYRIIIQ